jgi:hypothetical protein
MPHEHFVLDRNAFANEAVRLNLAARADHGPGLDFHEGADGSLVSNTAAVEIYEIRMRDPYALSEFCRRRYGHWGSRITPRVAQYHAVVLAAMDCAHSRGHAKAGLRASGRSRTHKGMK